ncbi:hypothetical protein Plhal304r1_c088g0170411 [Plasmopara halstedii]
MLAFSGLFTDVERREKLNEDIQLYRVYSKCQKDNLCIYNLCTKINTPPTRRWVYPNS